MPYVQWRSMTDAMTLSTGCARPRYAVNQPPLAKRTILQMLPFPTHHNPHVFTGRWPGSDIIDEPVPRNEIHETPKDPEQERNGQQSLKEGYSFVVPHASA